jgi:hypothetical protein
MNLGENTYKRKGCWERKRRIVIDEPESQGWKPYGNLPIAPGLPDVNAYEVGGRPTRSTCEDVGNEDFGIHMELLPIDPPEELPPDVNAYELGGPPTRSTCEDLGNEDIGVRFDVRAGKGCVSI